MSEKFKSPTQFGPRSQFLVFLLLAFISVEVSADPSLRIRNNDEYGNYEIESDADCHDGCKLRESTDFGATWSVIASAKNVPTLATYTITGKPDGTYRYQLSEKEIDYDEEEIILEYSPIKEIIVGPVYDPPTLEEQLGYDYSTRVGDINSDGLQDIFLYRTTAAPVNNGTIRSVLLKQLTGGQFQTIVPNTSQTNVASSWPLAAIEVILADVNLDGYADARLDGVGNVITGVYDQLVYSPAVAYTGVARNVRVIDPNFESFANDMMSYYLDEDYFTDRETQVYESGEWELEYDCELDWRGILGWEWVCTTEYVWEPGGWITEYPGVHDSAVSIWKSAISADAGQLPWENVVTMLARQFGVDIQVGPWCIRVGGGVGSDCENAGISHSILSLFVLLKHPKSPKARSAGTVYLTGHRWALVGPMHTAVEITTNIAGVPVTRILSAEKVGSYLKSIPNRSADVRNVTLSTVTSYLVQYAGQPLLHFGAMEVADSHYKDDCLIYEPLPRLEFPLYFNSNSYTAGLLGVTGSILATGSMSDYQGGQVPVPNVYFTSATPCP